MAFQLIVYGAMREDSGIYTCETASGEDRVQTEIAVRAEKARIVFSPQGKTVSGYGEKVLLYAELSKGTDVSSVLVISFAILNIWPHSGRRLVP